MPKFNKDVFITHILSYSLNYSVIDIDSLADDLLAYNYNKETNWQTYKEDLRLIIKKHSFVIKEPDRGYPFTVPEIDKVDVSDRQNILNYLDFTKGLHIESEICRYLVESPTLVYKYEEYTGNKIIERAIDIKYDYMEQLFNVYKIISGKPDKKRNFNLIYATYLITGIISEYMMYSIINAYGKEVTGGFSATLNPVFSKRNLSDSATADTLMQIIHILRIPKEVCGNTKKNMAIAEYLIKCCFSRNFYDPRSFIQMIYYYATVNDIPYDKMRNLFEITTQTVMNKVLYGIINKECIDNLLYNPKIKPEEWISMDNYRIIDSSVMKALRKASDYDNDKLYDLMAENVRRIFVEEKTNRCTTYDIFCQQILTKMDYTPEEFINYITNSQKFYEGFFEAHRSYSRSRELNITLSDDMEMMAYDIVFNDVLHKEKIFQNGKHYGLYKFTSSEFKIMSEQERKEYLHNDILKCFNFLKNYSSEKDDSNVWGNIKNISNYPIIAERYSNSDNFIDQLVDCILSFVTIIQMRKKNKRTNKSERCDVLFELFRLCCENGGNAADFTVDVDDNAQELYFDRFYSLRFHDAFLYLCMKTELPMQTFNEINKLTGYSYWDN